MRVLFDLYYKKLFVEECTNPGKILASFFWELYELHPKPDEIWMFNKLIKMYGVNIVFKAIVTSYDMTNIDFTKSTYPLLAYLCKKTATDEFSKRNNSIILDTEEIEAKVTKLEGKKLQVRLEESK